VNTQHPTPGTQQPTGKPDWLKVRLPHGPQHARLKSIIQKLDLHTVCEEALCPNQGRCWENGKATIMILGGVCTRDCRFCAVSPGQPGPTDREEPERAAAAVRALGLRDVVITSVTRDDLADGGAAVWARTLRRIREAVPGATLEALVPDFAGSETSLDAVLDAGPDILGHNLETVPSLYARARPCADYTRSLALLANAHERGVITKTALMLGLGETSREVRTTMKDALKAGCDILYLGQYLQPTKAHLPVQRYVHPDEFDAHRKQGLDIGFKVVVSAPLVRSSYYSEEQAEYVRVSRGESASSA
jgi:lipoic acid synthetase